MRSYQAVLSSAASYGLERKSHHQDLVDPASIPRLLLFSAKHSKTLKRMLENHQSYHLSHPASLSDMSYSLATKREALSHRAFVVTDGIDDWVPTYSSRPAPRTPSMLVFVFSGQGAQWAQMGKELIQNVPAFRDSLEAMDRSLHSFLDGPTWHLIGKSFHPVYTESKLPEADMPGCLDEIMRPHKTSRISQAELSQPCSTAIQVALVDLLKLYGVCPDVVVGHSSGEIAAAYACGSLTAEEAIAVAYYRGKVMLHTTPEKTPGMMAAIGLGAYQVEPYLTPGVMVGCENSPESTTITGDKDAVEDAMKRIKDAHPDILVRALLVDKAYHSRE